MRSTSSFGGLVEAGDRDLLLLAGAQIFGRDVHGCRWHRMLNVTSDLRYAARRSRDPFEAASVRATCCRRHFAFALQELMSTEVWPSSAVVKICVLRVGIVVSAR